MSTVAIVLLTIAAAIVAFVIVAFFVLWLVMNPKNYK